MTVETHDKLGSMSLKAKEGQLKSEKRRHSEQIMQSEGEVSRCNDELSDIYENQLDGLRDELFAHEEEEAIIVDDAHVVHGRRKQPNR